ncbi:torsin-1B [Cloeon dipterum]|uniref:torsin-1B n=1 Tax=Cloeon dipterum TaxID=197152 RepID=UPI00322006CF
MKLVLLVVACAVLLPENRAWEWSDFTILSEWCYDSWIPVNESKFKQSLRENVFGQPLVEETLRTVFAHLRPGHEPRKALVLAFQGWPGVGKNLVTNLLAKSIYARGTDSSFFKLYNSRIDFPLENKAEEYKKRLQQEVKEKLAKCARSLFVFDEIDMMPPKVIDGIKPYFDYQEKVDGVDPRRAVYIFLSNKGGSRIAEIAYELWEKNVPRENFRLSDFKEALQSSAFNEKGGLQHSDSISSFLVSFHVPFLPLQKEHVAQCIDAELRRRGVVDPDDTIASAALQEVVFTKRDTFTAGLFASGGCKTIDSIVSTAVVALAHDEL